MAVKDNPKIFFWASLFGSVSFLAPVNTLFYLHRGLQYSDLLVMLMFIVISMFLFEVPTGAFADRYGPKTSFIVGQLLSITIGIILIFAFNRWTFYAISVLTGLAITFFSGSDESFIYESLKESKKEKDMSKVWGKIVSTAQIAGIFTILIGAIIAKDLLEWQFVTLILLGSCFGILKLIALFKLTDPKHFHVKDTEMFQHIKQGFKFLKHSPALLLLFMNETFVLIPIHIFNQFNQPLFVDAKIVVIFIGIIYVTNSILNTAILQNIEWFERNFTRKQLVNYTGIFTLIGFLIAAFYGMNWYIAVLAYFLIKTANALRYPLFSQIKNDYIPSKSRSTTLSLLSMIDSAFDVIIFASIGLIANIGLTAIFIGCSVVVLLGLLFPVKIIKETKAANQSNSSGFQQ